MKKITHTIICGILILLVWGCSGKRTYGDNVLASVGDKTLTQEQVNAIIPLGLSDSATVEFTTNYIDNWIVSQLLYDMARKNLPDAQRLDELVENYRRDLFCYEYRRRLSDERLSQELSEDTLQQFYEVHKNEFTLYRPILKGLLLKVPANAPQLSSLRQWVANAGKNGVENIEKYAVKNAIGYDYFFDRWVWFDDIKDNIPYDFGEDAQFLSQRKVFEHRHDGTVYLLYIDSYRLAGDIVPYEFARPRILEILLNELRMNFNQELEQALYEEAVSDGLIDIFYNQPNDTTVVEPQTL